MRARIARVIQPGQRIRVLVVDDSVVIRRLVCHALEEDPGVEVAAVAANGRIALDRVAQANPDVITLDIEMPEMDGLEMLRELRRQNRTMPVVMFSTMTERGASATLEALSLGADDYVTKASNAGSLDISLANLRQQLIPKIRQFFQIAQPRIAQPIAVQRRDSRKGPRTHRHRDALPAARYRHRRLHRRTGGAGADPSAVPPGLRLPVFVVQHMPPLFTRLLAERLATLTSLAVREAVDGETPEPGRIYVAPGDLHMRLMNSGGGPRIVLDQGPPLNSCRPAVDALFASLADVYGPAVVAAVLTGMGQDGMRGAERLSAQGAHILAQDEATSVVWGMPGAVVHAGIANEVVPLDEVVPAILREVNRA